MFAIRKCPEYHHPRPQRDKASVFPTGGGGLKREAREAYYFSASKKGRLIRGGGGALKREGGLIQKLQYFATLP